MNTYNDKVPESLIRTLDAPTTESIREGFDWYVDCKENEIERLEDKLKSASVEEAARIEKAIDKEHAAIIASKHLYNICKLHIFNHPGDAPYCENLRESQHDRWHSYTQAKGCEFCEKIEEGDSGDQRNLVA